MNVLYRNYLINRYENDFKSKDGSIYISLNDMINISCFDDKLRLIFLKYILEIEVMFKLHLYDIINSKYDGDYLCDLIFNENISKSRINYYERTFKKRNNEGNTNCIEFFNKLSFGQMVNYYSILNESNRNTISKIYNVSSRELLTILNLLKVVRNICAHSDSLYSFKSKMKVSSKLFSSSRRVNTNITTAYTIFELINIFIDEDKAASFKSEVFSIICNLKNNNRFDVYSKILNYLGIPKNKEYRLSLNWFLDNILTDAY